MLKNIIIGIVTGICLIGGINTISSAGASFVTKATSFAPTLTPMSGNKVLDKITKAEVERQHARKDAYRRVVERRECNVEHQDAVDTLKEMNDPTQPVNDCR
jgi:hypothetical protein